MGSPQRILGLLVGNSSLRHGVLEGGAVLRSARAAWNDLAAGVAEALRSARELGAVGAVAGSVREDLLERLESMLPAPWRPIALAGRDFPIPVENRYRDPEEVGVDRLLALLSASRRAAGGGAVVVDFGTAVTVSVASPEGAFLGGLIGAGTGVLVAGFQAATPRLATAAVELLGGGGAAVPGAGARPPRAGEALERDTRAALGSGVYWEMAGGVRAMLHRVLESLPFRSRVFATGGDAERFAAEIPEIDEVAPDLAMEGLAIAHADRPRDPQKQAPS